MHMTRSDIRRLASIALAALLLSAALVACGGGGGDPTDVLFGETTFVVVLNPVVNDINEAPVPAPGTERAGVLVASDDGPDDVTDPGGVATLAGVGAGTRTLALSGAGIDATLGLDIDDGDLREIAIAADGDGAAVMSEVVWAFGNDVVEVTPDMSPAAVNDALAASGSVVFFAGGTYTGDLFFTGSDVTLFGEGPYGGRVILDGNVTIEGSGNRIRGAVITGDLDIPGSGVSVSFTRVEGQLIMAGSSGVLLYNDFCGPVAIEGSGVTALDNTGLAPLPALDDCPVP
jgi:hypothetical protein